jgi:hypothetical protein
MELKIIGFLWIQRKHIKQSRFCVFTKEISLSDKIIDMLGYFSEKWDNLKKKFSE